jgi:homogentisate 1,2-dioxygenase
LKRRRDADLAATVVYKLTGELFYYEQAWTPFDVVAWHGK